MKVCCVKLLDARGNSQENSVWLTVGKIYIVLSIELTLERKWMLRLNGDGKNGVALFRLDCFQIVSANIPKNWIAVWRESGFFQLAPETWTEAGFWERFYDQEYEALCKFDEESKLIQYDA